MSRHVVIAPGSQAPAAGRRDDIALFANTVSAVCSWKSDKRSRRHAACGAKTLVDTRRMRVACGAKTLVDKCVEAFIKVGKKHGVIS